MSEMGMVEKVALMEQIEADVRTMFTPLPPERPKSTADDLRLIWADQVRRRAPLIQAAIAALKP